jgi:hypothetical protein
LTVHEYELALTRSTMVVSAAAETWPAGMATLMVSRSMDLKKGRIAYRL